MRMAYTVSGALGFFSVINRTQIHMKNKIVVENIYRNTFPIFESQESISRKYNTIIAIDMTPKSFDEFCP